MGARVETGGYWRCSWWGVDEGMVGREVSMESRWSL